MGGLAAPRGAQACTGIRGCVRSHRPPAHLCDEIFKYEEVDGATEAWPFATSELVTLGDLGNLAARLHVRHAVPFCA